MPRAPSNADWSGTWTGSGSTIASLQVKGGKFAATGACDGSGCVWGDAAVVAQSGNELFLAWPNVGVSATLQQTDSGNATVLLAGQTKPDNLSRAK